MNKSIAERLTRRLIMNKKYENHFNMTAGKYKFKIKEKVYLYNYATEKPDKIEILGRFSDNSPGNGYYYYVDGDDSLSNVSEWALFKTKQECIDFENWYKNSSKEFEKEKREMEKKLKFKVGDIVYTMNCMDKKIIKREIGRLSGGGYVFYENKRGWYLGEHGVFKTKSECIKNVISRLKKEIKKINERHKSRMTKLLAIKKAVI